MAGYDDAAGEDDGVLKKLSHKASITIDGLVLVSRDAGGKITVKETGDDDDRVIGGTIVGVIGGFALGLFFPPAIIGTTILGGRPPAHRGASTG